MQLSQNDHFVKYNPTAVTNLYFSVIPTHIITIKNLNIKIRYLLPVFKIILNNNKLQLCSIFLSIVSKIYHLSFRHCSKICKVPFRK